MIYILVPSELKLKAVELVSCPTKLKLVVKEAVEISHAVLNEYSFTSSPKEPVIKNLVPLLLKYKPLGVVS